MSGSRSPIGEESVRVFLVDDHEVVRRSVRDLLELSGGIVMVGEADNAESACSCIVETRPDVAVVDLRLGDASGIEVCRRVHAETDEVATLILTADDAQEALLATALAGATGYVLKLVRGAGLIDHVRRAAGGDTLVDDQQRRHALDRLRSEDGPRGLTAQDHQLLDLIAGGRTDPEIAAQARLSPEVVSSQVSSLLVKLGFLRWAGPAVPVSPLGSPFGA